MYQPSTLDEVSENRLRGIKESMRDPLFAEFLKFVDDESPVTVVHTTLALSINGDRYTSLYSKAKGLHLVAPSSRREPLNITYFGRMYADMIRWDEITPTPMCM